MLEPLEEGWRAAVVEEWSGWHPRAAGMLVAAPHSAGRRHGLMLGQKPERAHRRSAAAWLVA